ncbi:2Fe-2S iron-sulfur cluster-binding protein [Cryobacterium sp. TMT1-66-1]|uniref:2Fe-2S iron-sulfur cluster-binding protein n=1 Tax=Cryobacterium sp. TMT1-66-1 TaxID=1259242 RepID=UPI001069FEC0|nr:2Fe-2S iron-sulfur cluster-binding protein [Cryobacterium sp. TMT1-66-1]TFD08194.1 2Fe-2S iron-sulfur cluster binding domain-containing protein [Cryobacterium sp. TMT1-66-1]
MPKVVYVRSGSDACVVDAQVGDTVMAVAVRSGVPGIIGECGGQLSCATCHVWVSDEFRDRVGGPGEMEADLLDLGVSDFTDASRLGCQITITDELDGLVVEPRPEAWH